MVAVDRRDLGALLIAATCWGVGTVVSKAALDEISPLTLLPIQLAASLAALAVLLRLTRRPVRVGSSTLERLGILNPGLAYALSLVGLMTISASLSVLLWAVEPLVILALAAVALGERPGRGFLLLSAVALFGIGLVVIAPRPATGELIGVALTLAGVACCATYTVAARRLLPGTTETGEIVFAQQAYALGFALVVAVVVAMLGGATFVAAPTLLGIASAILSGLLYYAAAYWFYLRALRRLPASLASASFYLVPIIGISVSSVVLGERLDPVQWVGALLAIGAVLAITRLPTTVAEPVPEAAR